MVIAITTRKLDTLRRMYTVFPIILFIGLRYGSGAIIITASVVPLNRIGKRL